MKGVGDVKTKFQIKMPRTADVTYEASWVKALTKLRSIGIKELVAYEMAYPNWAKLSLGQKLEELAGNNGERIARFRRMCMESSVGRESTGMHFFAISYPTYVKILMEKDKHKATKLLDREMEYGGGKVCPVAFKQMTAGSFEQYLNNQKRDEQAWIGGCAIMLTTLNHEVERICYMRRKEALFTEKQEEALAKIVAGDDADAAMDFLKSPDVQNFLANPESDPAMLANIMGTISLEDPLMAENVRKHLAITCAKCNIQRTGLLACGICKAVRYCGTECQKAHWKLHRQTCEEKI
jgi:hypothetical protein